MPSSPLRERIALAYRAALDGSGEARVGSALVGTGTVPNSHHGVRNAFRVVMPAPGAGSFPYRVLAWGAEKVTPKTRELNHVEARLVIIGTHRLPFGEDPNPETVANELAADIQAAMESTALLAALGAIAGWERHREDGVTPLLAWPAEPLVSCEVVYTVWYRRNRTDPSEGVP